MWHGRTQDNIVRLVDDFYHPAKRPSRLDHACLVFEVLGPNLLTFLEAHIRNVKNQQGGALPGQAGGLPLSLVKEFAKQMLAGTAYLHDFCRHIHTDLKVSCFPIESSRVIRFTDLQPENIALTLPNIERIVKREISTTMPTSTLVETSRSARTNRPPDNGINSSQLVQIFESQPLPTPIYRLTTPRSSSDDENTTSPSSSFQANESTGSSHGETTNSTASQSNSTNHSAPYPTTAAVGIPSDIGSKPVAIATPSSPITSTFAHLSRRLSSSFNSLSLSSWTFARSPPTREPLSTILQPPIEDDKEMKEKEKEKLDQRRQMGCETKSKVLPDLGVKIVDFGNAQPISEVYFGRIQTRQYRAPEVIIGRRDWDRKVDVWSIACIIFELVTGDYLFDPPEESKNRDRDHIYQILELTNPFYDRRWVMGGRQSSKIFSPNGTRIFFKPFFSHFFLNVINR